MSKTKVTNNGTSSFQVVLPRAQISWEGDFPQAKSLKPQMLALFGSWIGNKAFLAAKMREADGETLWTHHGLPVKTFTGAQESISVVLFAVQMMSV